MFCAFIRADWCFLCKSRGEACMRWYANSIIVRTGFYHRAKKTRPVKGLKLNPTERRE